MPRKIISAFVILAFLTTAVPVPGRAGEVFLPAPGVRMVVSPAFMPPMILGITVDAADPMKFNFLIDQGDVGAGHARPVQDEDLKEEYSKLIKYFLASLTIPEKDLWVNLSPYEGQRIIPQAFGQTEMGRDLLGQDYVLKQITASLIYPESELGKKFWADVYKKAHEQYGTTNIPVNTFNKVWIVPDEAMVYEHDGSAFVVKSHLKVMLEEDYLSLKNNSASVKFGTDKMQATDVRKLSNVSAQVVRDIVLPALEKEVNEGKNFALLRQINNALILATWYKRALKESLLGKFYVDKAKVKGIELEAGSSKLEGKNPSSLELRTSSLNVEQIYQQYLEAFKKGVYNFIKEDRDPYTRQTVPRKYFSGGFEGKYAEAVQVTRDQSQVSDGFIRRIKGGMDGRIVDVAMLASEPDTGYQKTTSVDVAEIIVSQASLEGVRRLRERMAKTLDEIRDVQADLELGAPKEPSSIQAAHLGERLYGASTETLNNYLVFFRDTQDPFLQGLGAIIIGGALGFEDPVAAYLGEISALGKSMKNSGVLPPETQGVLRDAILRGRNVLAILDRVQGYEENAHVRVFNVNGRPIPFVVDEYKVFDPAALKALKDYIPVLRKALASDWDKIKQAVDQPELTPQVSDEVVRLTDHMIRYVNGKITAVQLNVIGIDMKVVGEELARKGYINFFNAVDPEFGGFDDETRGVFREKGYSDEQILSLEGMLRESRDRVKAASHIMISALLKTLTNGFMTTVRKKGISPDWDVINRVATVLQGGAGIDKEFLMGFVPGAEETMAKIMRLLSDIEQSRFVPLVMLERGAVAIDPTALQDKAMTTDRQVYKILLVESDATFAQLTSARLREAGYEVETAANAAKLLQRYPSGRYSAVIAKWEMPGVSGTDLIQGIRDIETRRREASAPFIIYTGNVGVVKEQALAVVKPGDIIAEIEKRKSSGEIVPVDAAIAPGVINDPIDLKPVKDFTINLDVQLEHYRVQLETLIQKKSFSREDLGEISRICTEALAFIRQDHGNDRLIKALIVTMTFGAMITEDGRSISADWDLVNGFATPVSNIMYLGQLDLSINKPDLSTNERENVKQRIRTVELNLRGSLDTLVNKMGNARHLLADIRQAGRASLINIKRGESIVEALDPVFVGDAAMSAVATKTPGGIDLNPANLNLRIKRDGKGVPLPIGRQDMGQLNNIEGLVPVIIRIVPATYIPALSDLLSTVN